MGAQHEGDSSGSPWIEYVDPCAAEIEYVAGGQRHVTGACNGCNLSVQIADWHPSEPPARDNPREFLRSHAVERQNTIVEEGNDALRRGLKFLFPSSCGKHFDAKPDSSMPRQRGQVTAS
jgi:hypothetical protein